MKTRLYRGSNARGRRRYRRKLGEPVIQSTRKVVRTVVKTVQRVVQPEKAILVPKPFVPPFAVGDRVRMTADYGPRYTDQTVTVESCTATEVVVKAKSWLRKTSFAVKVEHLEKV